MEYPQYNGKLLMKPSKANVKRTLTRSGKSSKGNKTAKQANLITPAQPDSAGLGKLSPPCGRQGNLCSG